MEDRGCPLWVGAAEVAEWTPSHPPSARQAGHAASPTARPRDAHPAGGGASSQTDQSPSAALALVVGTGAAGSGNDLAGVCRPVLERTPLSLLQTGPQMDDPQIPLPRGGGPLDLAGDSRVRPPAPCSSAGRRAPPALAGTTSHRETDASARPTSLFAPAATVGSNGDRTKTLWTLAQQRALQQRAAGQTVLYWRRKRR